MMDEIEAKQEHGDLDQIRVDELNVSTRARDWFRKADLATVADLLTYSRREILAWPNMGRTTLREIEECVKGLGATLRDESQPRDLEFDHVIPFRGQRP